MKALLGFILARLKERSTWLGLTSLLSAVGVALSPEISEKIVIAGVAVASLIVAATSDS